MEHELLVVDDNDNEDDLVQVDDEAVAMGSYASPAVSQPPQPAPPMPAIMMPPPDPPTPATPAPVATPVSISNSVPEVQNVPVQSTSGRVMRSSNNPYATRNAAQQAKPKKLKLKLGAKATAQAPNASFLGSYDRELDSDADEEGSELLFEEHFILRMPPGEECERLRKMVQNRDVTNDVWFKFKGMHSLLCLIRLTDEGMMYRFAAGSISYRQERLLGQTRRFTVYHRVSEDVR
jgi:hypothetical protein